MPFYIICERTGRLVTNLVKIYHKNLYLLQRISRRRPKPKFFKSTSGSSSVEYSADVEDTGVGIALSYFIHLFHSNKLKRKCSSY